MGIYIMKTFEQVWKETKYQYGEDALENVKLGWELAIKEISNNFKKMLKDINDEKHEKNVIENVKRTREYIAQMEAQGKEVPHWMHPCCDREDRDNNGGCKNCGDPCF